MYGNVIIHEDARVPYGNAANNDDGVAFSQFNTLGTLPNIARGVFMGAQSLAMCYGRAYGVDSRLKWYEELLDAANQLRVTSGSMFGIKKLVFNGADFATVTVSSYETVGSAPP